MMPLTSHGLGPREKRGLCLSTLGVCGGCGRRPQGSRAKHCSRCHGESYCEAACQRRAWTDAAGHKNACKALCKLAVGTEGKLLPDVLKEWTVSDATREAVELVSADASAGTSEGEDLFARAFDLLYGVVGLLQGPVEQERFDSLPKGPRDEGEAHVLLRRAADLGHKGAQYQLALAYIDGGYFAKKDNRGAAIESELLHWIKHAAENGHAEAQMTYGGKFWYEGRGGHEVDMRQAVAWVRRALAHGVSENEGPDITGNALSRRSFEGGVTDAVEMGRKLYLEHFPSFMDGDAGSAECMRIAGDCGILPAIQTQVS
ncbi:hypothetical protein ACHAXT_002732 [Thalassiosira profunda]